MDVSPIQPHVDAAELPLEQLADNPQLNQEQKLAEVARQFEAVLLRHILQNTQKTVISSEFSDNSTAASIYHDLITQQLAESISKSGTMGLARMLQLQLNYQLHPASTAGHDRTPEAQPTSHPGTDVARPPSCAASHPIPVSDRQPPDQGNTALISHE